VQAEHDLVKELVRLRRGWGLQNSNLRERVGPQLTRLCRIDSSDNDRSIQQKIRAWLAPLNAELAPDLQRALALALAIDHEYQHRQLTLRVDRLAAELSCQPRTARRRIDHAFQSLAQVALQRRTADTETDPETGWCLRSLRSVFRLDTPTPELHETRTIVATRDGLDTIAVRASLPKPPGNDTPNHDTPNHDTPNHDTPTHDIVADLVYGARIVSVERIHDSQHFRWTLALPRSLSTGDEHEYQMYYRIPPRQAMRPHYAFLPLIPCESFVVRMRFPVSRLPVAIWRLDGVPPRLLDDDRPGAHRLRPDGAGEVELRFTDLKQGRGYGLAWTPAEPSTPDEVQTSSNTGLLPNQRNREWLPATP
jgi:hypothetical protein